MPMIWLIVAALLLWVVRRLFDIGRWHGPADSIFGAHRLENEIDVKSGIGSTVGAFVSISGGASVGQYGPLVHFGATIGTFLRQIIGKNQEVNNHVYQYLPPQMISEKKKVNDFFISNKYIFLI